MVKRPTHAQIERMIQFMEKNPLIAKGQKRCSVGHHETKSKWKELARMLNSMGGLKKTKRQWAKYWADKKYCVGTRLARRNADALLNTEPRPLSALDARISRLVWDNMSDLSKKKEPVVEEPEEQPGPSTTHASSSTNASQAMDFSSFYQHEEEGEMGQNEDFADYMLALGFGWSPPPDLNFGEVQADQGRSFE